MVKRKWFAVGFLGMAFFMIYEALYWLQYLDYLITALCLLLAAIAIIMGSSLWFRKAQPEHR